MRRFAVVVCLSVAFGVAEPAAAPAKRHMSACTAAKRLAKQRTTHKLTRRGAARLRTLRRRCARLHRRAAAAPAAGGTPSAPAGGVPGAPQTSAPATATPTPEPGGDTVPPLPPSNPRALQVISGEFFLNLSKGQVLAGDVRVEFNNAFAEDPHDLHLVREDGIGQSYAFGELGSGQIEARTLSLSTGTWELFCALPEHAKRGMTATLKVAAG